MIDRETSVPQLDTDEALAAMQTFLELAASSPVESAAVDEADNAERFGAGQISMMANFWSSDLLAARTATSSSEAGPLASMLQPAQPGVAHRAMTGVWLAGIPAGSLAVDAARGFLTWLSGRELQGQLPGLNNDVTLIQRAVVGTFGQIPAPPSLRSRLRAERTRWFTFLKDLVATVGQTVIDRCNCW